MYECKTPEPKQLCLSVELRKYAWIPRCVILNCDQFNFGYRATGGLTKTFSIEEVRRTGQPMEIVGPKAGEPGRYTTAGFHRT